ncbi:MAG: DUF58 domain-containing protein [Lachnospiraceae bacterium]|nr:DUF58 domain-containing protein [Lachnospiraceae bacterium]
MKINVKILIIYIFAIVLLSAIALIYEQPVIVLFILMLIVIALISMIIFVKVNDKIEFSLSPVSEYVEEPNSPSFRLEYKNSARLGLFTGDVEFSVENRFYPNSTVHKLSVPLNRKENSFIIPVESYNIGLVTLKINRITLFDYLSIVRKTIEPSFESSVPILPQERNIGDFPPAVPKDGPDEFTESENIGNISSDVKEIREYRPGDRLQRIHWKLSAKLDDLFVKEMAHTSTLAIILLPELCEKEIHATSSSLLSCIKKMYTQKERFEVCIYNDKTCDYSFFTVIDEEGMLEAMTHFYCQPLYEGRENALNTFISSSNRVATVVHIIGTQIRIGE